MGDLGSVSEIPEHHLKLTERGCVQGSSGEGGMVGGWGWGVTPDTLAHTATDLH